MKLEELNKSQIVLLTMLVSFVTSIATGIVTISLVEKAPTDVTRVVQRVVERTVERVTPETTQQATIITKEKTIIIKEADLIAAAIADNKSKIVSVVEADTGAFVSLGVFVDEKGMLAMDAGVIKDGVKYAIDVGGEEFLPASISYEGGARGIALLKVEAERIGVKQITQSEESLRLGQTLVAFIGGNSITQGIITDLEDGGYISISFSGSNIAPGAPLLNVDGEVIGLSTSVSRKISKSTFSPIRAAFAIASTETSEEDKNIDNTKETQ